MSVGSQALLMRLVADGKKLFRVTEAIYNTWSSALHKSGCVQVNFASLTS